MQKKCEKCETMFEPVRSSMKYCSKPCAHTAWVAQNAEKIAATRARYYEKNGEAQAARIAAWHAANPDRVREIKRAYYHRNKAKVIAAAAGFASENPEKVSAYKAKHEKTEAGRINRKAITHRRRARILANGGSFSRDEWLALVERTGNRCVACFTPSTAVQLEADHIVPIKLGGSNDISNIQPLCVSCNRRKAASVKNYIEALDAPVAQATKGDTEPENGT